MPYLYAREAPPPRKPFRCCHAICSDVTTERELYRCDDCFGRQLHCLGCFNKRHRALPFHQARCWTPDPQCPEGEDPDPLEAHFYVVTSQDRGFVLQLGHRGDNCPAFTPGSRRTLHVMHTNGIHVLSLAFCRCTHKTFWEQLLEHDLFPGTDDDPQSAFSFALLDHFQTFNLVCKTAARDFHEALKRMTDGAFPDRVPASGFHSRKIFRTLISDFNPPSLKSEYVPALWSCTPAVACNEDAQKCRILRLFRDCRRGSGPSLPGVPSTRRQPPGELDG